MFKITFDFVDLGWLFLAIMFKQTLKYHLNFPNTYLLKFKILVYLIFQANNAIYMMFPDEPANFNLLNNFIKVIQIN